MIRYIDDQTLHTRSAAWPEPRHIERVGSLLLIFSDSDKSHAGRLLLLSPAQQARSIANTRAITLRECVRERSVRIGRLNFFLYLHETVYSYTIQYNAWQKAEMPYMKQKNKRTKEKRESFTPAWVLDPRWTPSQVEPRALSQHGPWKI